MTKLEVWCGVHQVEYLVPVVMVDCGLARLNEYHLSHYGTLGGRKPSSSGATIGTLGGVAP